MTSALANNRFSSIFQDDVQEFSDSIELVPVTVSAIDKRTFPSSAKTAVGKKSNSQNSSSSSSSKDIASIVGDVSHLSSLEIVSKYLQKKEEDKKRAEEEEKRKLEDEKLRQEQERKRIEDHQKGFLESSGSFEEESLFYSDPPHHQRGTNRRPYLTGSGSREHRRDVSDAQSSPRQYQRAHDREPRSFRRSNPNVSADKKFSDVNQQLDLIKAEPIAVDLTSITLGTETLAAHLSAAAHTPTTTPSASPVSILTLDQYLAEQTKNALHVNLPCRPPCSSTDDSQWNNAVPFIKKDESLFGLSANEKKGSNKPRSAISANGCPVGKISGPSTEAHQVNLSFPTKDAKKANGEKPKNFTSPALRA